MSVMGLRTRTMLGAVESSADSYSVAAAAASVVVGNCTSPPLAGIPALVGAGSSAATADASRDVCSALPAARAVLRQRSSAGVGDVLLPAGFLLAGVVWSVGSGALCEPEGGDEGSALRAFRLRGAAFGTGGGACPGTRIQSWECNFTLLSSCVVNARPLG